MGKEIRYETGESIGLCVYLGEDFYQNGDRSAKFKCQCGNIFNCNISRIKTFKTKSCGCKSTTRNRIDYDKHGMTKTSEYESWAAMICRCTNELAANYPQYGGRGISVCERWLSFNNFIDDMGVKPTKLHTIDRHPNKYGNYEPGNCRWATKKEQAINRSTSIIIVYKGEEVSLKLLADKMGVSAYLMRDRIQRLKWSPERAFDTPVIEKHRRKIIS